MSLLLTFLSSFGLSILGLTLYFFVKAFYYVRTGKFCFGKWRSENLTIFVYSGALILLLISLFTLSPSSKDLFLNALGIDLKIGGEVHKNLAPELLGALIGAFVYRTKKEFKKSNEKRPAETGEPKI